MLIRAATPADLPVLAVLRNDLWPEGSVEEHAEELPGVLADPGSAVFVAESQGRIVGWAEARLRSHADGCQTSPVGYLEGWYVAPDWRRKGVGAGLVASFEAWARDRGCLEVASDTALENAASEAAHLRLGFEISDRAIRFRKSLVPGLVVGPGARPPLDRTRAETAEGAGHAPRAAEPAGGAS